MTRYELVVLLHPDLEIDLDNPIKKIEKLLSDNGGANARRDNWGKRKLAYAINRQDFALYVYWEADLPAEAVAKIDRALGLMDEVLRHLITKHVEVPEPKEHDVQAAADKEAAKEKEEEKE